MVKKINDRLDQDTRAINYAIQGTGSPVILVHGIGASLHDWDVLLPEVANHGYQAIALDLLGHGDSSKPDDPRFYTIENLYETFKCWLNSLEITSPIAFIGHSLGGFISLKYAVDHPQAVHSISLINPYFRSDQLSRVLRALIKKPRISEKAMQITPLWLIDWILGWDPVKSDRFSSETRYQIAYDYKRATPLILRIPGTLPDITPAIINLSVPTMVIWGQKDQTLNPTSFPQLVKMLGNGEGKMIKGAGHQPHIAYPDRVNGWILDFIRTH